MVKIKIPAALENGSENKPVEAKKPRKRLLIIFLAAAVGLAGCIGGFLWWKNQPAQRFPYWKESLLEGPEQSGLDIRVSVTREEDGSGVVCYTAENNTGETKYFDRGAAWLEYFYKNKYYGITGPCVISLVGGINYLEPGESSYYKEKSLPPGTLSFPGRYRLCFYEAGWVEFTILEDWEIVTGESDD